MALGMGGSGEVMRAVILVPWRPSTPERVTIWKHVRTELSKTGLPIFATDSPGEWSRSVALNRAAKRNWDVAYVTDADKAVESPAQILHALATAYYTGRYTKAADILYYLDEHGDIGEEVKTWEDQFAIRRDRWDELGGFDERFVGYGYQGIAFVAAASTLFGKASISGPGYHYEHPVDHKTRLEDLRMNQDLIRSYHQATDDPEAMRGVLCSR